MTVFGVFFCLFFFSQFLYLFFSHQGSFQSTVFVVIVALGLFFNSSTLQSKQLEFKPSFLLSFLFWAFPWSGKHKSLDSVRLFGTPWIVAHQAALSTEFSGQEYWSGHPCPPPGRFPDPGIQSRSPVAGRSFTVWASRGALNIPLASSNNN